ncbi:MAG: PKD domain-containing protein, partial [Cytophagales bacterium]|nr:PKD domain-containing protein [Cytophagales bacterium]
EFTGVTINTNPFDFSFTGITVAPIRYGVVVMAEGITPEQHPTCLYETYGFVNDITIETHPSPNAAFRFRYPLIRVGDYAEITLEELDPRYSYSFDWGTGDVTVPENVRFRGLMQNPGTYNVTLTVTSDQGCVSQTTEVLRVFDYICESPVPDNGGQFYVDNTTGKIVFRRESCPGNFLLSCLSATAQPNIFDNAVAASAVTYDDHWQQDLTLEQPRDFDEDANVFERGERGKWRVKNTYAFNVPLQESENNFSAGTFKLEDFSWRYEDANDPAKWVRSTTVERYSLDGEALQERNALDVPSAAKFGYSGALPYLTAQNAEYQDVHFESFEAVYDDHLEDNIAINNNGIILSSEIVHAGRQSALLTGQFRLPAMHLSEQLVTNGLMMKVWVHATQASHLSDLYFTISGENGTAITSSPFSIVATIGPWQLLEAMITDFGILVTGDFRENADLLIPSIENRGSEPVWIDDLRYQPADAEMTAYVYDPRNFRLLTVFDDQHFGLYYQYNAEGKLVRKRIETERGVKTVQEAQFNVPKVGRGE